MQHTPGRRGQVAAVVAVAALLLIGAAGCGGGSSDSSGGSDGAAKTTQAKGSDDSGSKGTAKAPNPCDLVSREKASEILGGESAAPDFTDNDTGSGSISCSWQTQAGKDNPTLDGAGHILTLNVTTPPESMTMDEFWTASKTGGDGESTTVEGCDEAFWLGGILSALKDDVYLTGTAGLNDSSPDAKASTQELIATACAAI